MANFKKNFKLTRDEKLKRYLYLYHLLLISKIEKKCSTCINSETTEVNNIGETKDFNIDCKLNLNESICSEYECDSSNFDYVIECIKDLFKGE